jgi:hypothetical protein
MHKKRNSELLRCSAGTNPNQLKINNLKIAQPEIRAYADIARRLGQNQLRRGSLLTFDTKINTETNSESFL